MKFTSATISGFAGISRTIEVDLDANVIVLLGSNGFGKSTICDALCWALTGNHPRGADPRSWYGSGETYVEVRLRDPHGASTSVRRIVSNPEAEAAKLATSLVVETGENRMRGPEAEFWLARKLVSDVGDSSATSGTVTDSLYLQQDSLREFLSSRSDDERFAALSQMVGARALSDLVAAFDSANRAWRKSVRQSTADLDRSTGEIEALRAEMANLERVLAEAERVQSAEVQAWWEHSCELLGMPLASREGVMLADLETAVADLQGMVSRDLTRKQRVGVLEQELVALLSSAPPPPVPAVSVDELDAQVERVEASRRRLEAASTHVQAVRSALQVAETRREELTALAQLALRHLSESCPTCGQEVDPASLRQRLEGVLSDSSSAVTSEGDALTEALLERDAVATQLGSDEAQLQGTRDAMQALQRHEAAVSERDRRRERLLSEIAELIEGEPSEAGWRGDVEQWLARLDSRVARATEQVSAFQVLRPALTTSGNASDSHL